MPVLDAESTAGHEGEVEVDSPWQDICLYTRLNHDREEDTVRVRTVVSAEFDVAVDELGFAMVVEKRRPVPEVHPEQLEFNWTPELGPNQVRVERLNVELLGHSEGQSLATIVGKAQAGAQVVTLQVSIDADAVFGGPVREFFREHVLAAVRTALEQSSEHQDSSDKQGD